LIRWNAVTLFRLFCHKSTSHSYNNTVVFKLFVTMKLKNYFKEQQNNTLNQNEKFFLYEKIISQKDKKSFARTKRFVSIRSFAYWFAMIILFVWIYWVYFFNGNFSYEWFVVQNWINEVSADYIANVVDFNWDFYIKHDWKYYKTSNISNWDHVILKKWSEIIFNIDEKTEAKIVWPAKFELSKKENNYQLLISQWDFIQMESINNQQSSIDIVIDDIKVSSKEKANFLITKDNDEYQINNQWQNITVTKDNDFTEIKSKQLLSINDDEVKIIENVKDFENAITQNNLSQTFAITNDTKDKDEDIVQTFIDDIDTKDTKISNTEIAENLGIVDNKQIPTEQQSKEIHSILNNNFVMWDIKEMFKSHILWKNEQYEYEKSNLNNRINKIYNLFDTKNNSKDIITNIENIKNELSTKYHIPSKYTENLQVIINRIRYIENKEILSEETDFDKLWQELETNTPSNLVLK